MEGAGWTVASRLAVSCQVCGAAKSSGQVQLQRPEAQVVGLFQRCLLAASWCRPSAAEGACRGQGFLSCQKHPLGACTPNALWVFGTQQGSKGLSFICLSI